VGGVCHFLADMKSKYDHLPLKAYEVYQHDTDWLGFRSEYSFGIHVGRTPGQARADVAADREIDNPWRGLRSRRVHGPVAERAIEDFEDARKYWRDTRAFARLQAAADEFNASWPVGTPVEMLCSNAPALPTGITFTRTPAWVPSLNGVLVSVDGFAGGFALKWVRPLIEPGAAPTTTQKGGASE
jgi:hypothetical protein